MNKVERARQSLTAQLGAIERLPAALLRRAFRGEGHLRESPGVSYRVVKSASELP